MAEPMTDPTPPPRLRLRLRFAGGAYLGPGKADLLAAIADTGSISAAARSMGMSYKRAWSLVEEMNAMFTAPVVDSARGGAGGGGAVLSDTGRAVLAHYTAVITAAQDHAGADLSALAALLRDMSDGK